MNWWEAQVVPRAVDVLLGSDEVRKVRARVCEGLEGEVLEIGFGSGLNADHYPETVQRVLGVEPSDVAWHIAERKHLGSGGPPVVRAGLDGQVLDLTEASVDSALSTFTMCTIPQVEAAMSEVHRVLRPGRSFHFLEHGLSPDPGIARWQHRLTPLQRRLFGGCHLDRPIADLVRAGGLVVEEVEQFYLPPPVPVPLSASKVVGCLYLGRAVKP
jgi:ubiquinone/menaquinone biosynthesis C-methylase UbiE